MNKINLFSGDSMKINDSFVIREIYGKTLLIPVKANDISQVPICANEHAKKIISSLLKFDNLDEVLNDLSKKYDLSNQNVYKDIENYIQLLLSYGLIV